MRLESTFTRELRDGDRTGLVSTLCVKIVCYLPVSQKGGVQLLLLMLIRKINIMQSKVTFFTVLDAV